MASSPSSMSGRRNKPGCMSAIAHLFDFNQALAGRKLLTDKKFGADLEPVRKISNDNVEHFKSKASSKGQIEFGKSASVSRRSVEVPMKALIAEEISHELARAEEPKSRAPSVVARLMGLDALPSDRNDQSILSGDFENSVLKVQSDRLQHGKSPALMSSRSFKGAGPPTRSASDLSSSRRSAWEEHTSNFESLSSQSHLHELDFKRVLDPWKDWKSESHERMQALNDLDVQLAAKQMLVKKKLSEAKLGLLPKHSGPQEKLYESKEFMDAIDFLQANKDFFARFLEEPDSLFAKHLRNGEENPRRGKVEELRRHPKSYSIGASENGVIAPNSLKEPPDLPKSPHRGYERSRQVDKRLPEAGLFRQELFVKAQPKHMKSTKHTVSNMEECQQAPTRIVVLKPGPGKVQNLMSLSQNSPRSPREFLDAMEVVKENSMDVLLDLKHKMQQEDARGDLKRTWTFVSEHSKNVRDPREIAREIARQVRENVLKDMRESFKKGTMSEFRMDSKMKPSNVVDRHDVGGVNASSKGSSIVLARDPTSEALSSLSSQLLDKKALQGVKGDPRRSLEQMFFRKSVAQSKNLHSAPLRTHYRHRDRGRPHRQRGPRVHGVDVINASQDHSAIETDVECDTDSCTNSVCESEADVYTRNDNVACITLLRSRSVPTSSPSFHGVEDVDGVVSNDISMGGEAKVVDVSRSFDAAIHRSGPSRRSLFRRKHFGSKGILYKGKTVANESEEMSIPKQVPAVQKFDLNVCSEHEKVQHQIDDLGPVLDSDSSASSLDDFLTLEAALIAEGMDGAKVPQGVPSQWTTRKTKVLSSTESPSKLLSLPDEGHMSADCEVRKNLPEQPSPVSVLDAPFHEEPAGPMDFSEISSGLKDLRGRLQLLKFVDQEAVSIQEEYQEEDCEFTDDTQSTINHIHSVVSDIEDADLVVDGILCPQGRMPELIYVQNLLVASGFTIDSATVLTCWHSPSQPLAACIFERVENSYISSESITIAREEAGLGTQTRHLLFNIVNEVLLQVLGPHVNCRTWWKCRQDPSNMPLGTDLVGKVWSGVCKRLYSHSEGQDTLGNLVAEDLATKDRWQDFSLDLEVVMLGVEKVIWNDLLEETLSWH